MLANKHRETAFSLRTFILRAVYYSALCQLLEYYLLVGVGGIIVYVFWFVILAVYYI